MAGSQYTSKVFRDSCLQWWYAQRTSLSGSQEGILENGQGFSGIHVADPRAFADGFAACSERKYMRHCLGTSKTGATEYSTTFNSVNPELQHAGL